MSNKKEFILLSIFTFIAFSYITSSAYLGIYGHNLWRQADTYSHILGFMNEKWFLPYQNFNFGVTRIFDIPIYQYLIAKLSLLADSHPLTTVRFVNLFLWGISAFCGFRICRLFDEKYAAIVFIFLFSTSPLILHYYSVPLPDLMSISLSMIGILILFTKGIDYKSITYALPALALSTLIKSPIAFVFVVFLFSYFLFSSFFYRKNYFKTGPTFIVFFILMIAAILAEQLRNILLSQVSEDLFAQDPSWYFGTLELRTTHNFWSMIWTRFNDWALFGFGYLYIMALGFSFLTKKRKATLLSLASITALLSGWLVFSNVYYIHDYYQLPVCIIIFISFSIFFSSICNWLATKLSINPCGVFKNIDIAIITGFSLLLVMVQPSFSDRERPGLYAGIEYALRNTDLFLFVSNDKTNNPAIGAHVSTKFEKISREDFERKCNYYIKQYNAILSDGESQCLAQNKSSAKYFVEDKFDDIVKVFFLKESIDNFKN